MTSTQILRDPFHGTTGADQAPAVDNESPEPRHFSVLSTLAVSLPAAALALAMSLFGIGNRTMWNDEYATWYASTLSWHDLYELLDNVDAVISPYYLLMHGWIAVFGDSEASMRLPSALAMGLAAALISLIGRRLFDSGVGLTAGLLFAALPAVSRYGQEARPYAFAIAFATLATLLLLRGVENPTWRRWILYGICLIAAGLVHIVILTVLLAHIVFVYRAFRSHGDFRLLRWIAGAVIAVTGALPLAAKGSSQSSAIAWIKADGAAIVQMPSKVFGSWQVAAVVAGVAAVAAAILIFRDRGPAILLLSWALFPPLFCYLTFPLLHLFLHRYLLFTLPAWCLLAASVCFALASLARGSRTSSPLSLSALVIVAAAFNVGASGQEAARASPVSGEPDFRGAAEAVISAARPGDGIVYSGPSRNGRRAFGYEERSRILPKDVLVYRTSQQNGEFGAQECANSSVCIGDVRRLWLVSATEKYMDPFTGMPVATGTFLKEAFNASEYRNFAHVRVFALTRKVVR